MVLTTGLSRLPQPRVYDKKVQLLQSFQVVRFR